MRRRMSCGWTGVVAWLVACSAAPVSERDAPSRTGGPRAEPSALPTGAITGGQTDASAPALDSDGGLFTPRGCGNGILTDDEACDDGNRAGGDGCDGDCLGIEQGYACRMPGMACRPIARCGDAVVADSEVCDDGNATDGDGCSSRCQLEPGYKCAGEPSDCSETTCGDGVPEGTESCDDKNQLPFDGCSPTCQAEPDCSGAACTSSCGDGLVIGEECDDGNRRDGDGCSSACTREEGFSCEQGAACDANDESCVLTVPAVFRDFSGQHPDFAVGCGELTTGLVQAMLSPAGKPVLSGRGDACIQSQDTFAEWYTDGDGRATVVGELTLYPNGDGSFVNRYGPNGERWMAPTVYQNVVYGGPGGNGCEMCTPSAQGSCYDPCVPWGNDQACCGEASTAEYDGNPLFFPVDDAPNALGDARERAKVPAEYGYDGWPWEDSVIPGAGLHNFYFTTEVVHWFKYAADTTARLSFTGDDDVWVFVNGRLAVDLGGPHVPMEGAVQVDAGSAARFGLEPGNVYEIRILHAERKVAGSTFKLTLAGFDASPSVCTPICGDGIVTAGEECDDGDNDGSYEGCAAGCVLGPRCGDGIVQAAEGEDCDDGNRRDGDGCGSACRQLVVL